MGELRQHASPATAISHLVDGGHSDANEGGSPIYGKRDVGSQVTRAPKRRTCAAEQVGRVSSHTRSRYYA